MSNKTNWVDTMHPKELSHHGIFLLTNRLVATDDGFWRILVAAFEGGCLGDPPVGQNEWEERGFLSIGWIWFKD